MLTIPNLISLLRLPLAILFVFSGSFFRAVVLILAAFSDFLDGFIARRYSTTSRYGTLIDPVMDKLFVIIVLATLIQESSLEPWEIASLLCRDISVFIFGIYLILTGKLESYRLRSIWSGKVTTALQFVVLFLMTLGITPSPFVFSIFILLGLAALFELYLTSRFEMRQDEIS
ncbi:CDP-alcohol phosphatidyltransferase family protein [Criblamydia sequanensis]|uniref:CDP-diacylglycerol--glycerol-3-phosphate 3-phosphatidyltransferase n=1 Tax=Candidatus Criblamydia sequanensis CRIB-18 TaxID=1437425 RepID=A0A090CZZ7_9BACT|nr:CDP-alcohol phosphatidyltransferase family protein [Criblamydia sequanensis]CDR34757.1 Putative CDP-diacylglycerol-glycerol-3-phosphate 3-phosphatidyltransferase [Criblamydia sequanensis CRIB-18]